MILLNIILLVSVPSSLAALGLLVYLSNPKSSTNRLFLAMALCLAGSSLGATAFSVTKTADWGFFWVKLTMVFASFLNPTLLMFLFAFPGDRVKIPKAVVIIDVILSSFLAAGSILNWLFSGVSGVGDTRVVHPGWLIPAFGIVFALHLIVLFSRMGHQMKVAHGRQKAQWRYMALGVFTMLCGVAACNVLLVVVFNTTKLIGLGVSSILFFEGAIFYAITRHRLLDIRFVVARTVGYAALVTVLFVFYTLAVFVTSDLLFQGKVESGQVFVYAVLAIFIGATFQPLNNWLQRITERIFFQSHYDSSDLLLKITKTLASTYDLDDLSSHVLSEILVTMNIERGATIVSIDNILEISAQSGMTEDWFKPEIIAKLTIDKHTMETQDIQDTALAKSMRHSHISVTIPLYVGETLQGFVLLGDKKSGEIYTDQDLKVLEILRRELAVAVESARNFKQVRAFNATLQREVDKATEQLRTANEQLSRKNHQLQQLDKLKDEFISVTSHELRTPLTAIRGYLWMVMNNKKDDSAKLYMDRAYVSAERLIDLVNDTLDISRIESGRVQLNPESTKLPALARLVVQELEPKATERHQQLTVKQATNLPNALCDADKVHQVLTNLIGNALKFTPEKGSITVHFYVDKQHIVTAITDTGPGISPTDQKRLFQKFSRLESTVSVPGTGLGLYLCQQIVELSKGKIWMDSQVGQGSTFFFSLPISKHQPSILPVQQHAFSR